MDELDSRARLIVERCPNRPGEVELSRGEAAHARARRLQRGDPVVLIDGTGTEARGTLLRLSRDGAAVFVEEIRHGTDSRQRIALFVAGLKRERLSWIAEKATELGATALTVVSTDLTQRFRATPELSQRLTRVAQEAAKQCGSARWPAISGPRDFSAILSEERDATRLILDPKAPPFPSLLEAPLALLIGPEGGWTEKERAAAGEKGWIAASLPAGLLRAETAAIAALVLARGALERASRAEGGRR